MISNVRFENVRLAAIGYELPAEVVTSAALEQRLAPLYAQLRLPAGQLEALTGIRERRWWPAEHSLSASAARAAVKALAAGGVATSSVGALIYAGVCREHLEPATACAVADALGLEGNMQVYDVSNACLGVLNGMVQVATAIQAGQLQAGLIVSCETARPIVELTIRELLAGPSMERFKTALATLTGGSGAIAVLLTHEAISPHAPRLLGGVMRAAPRHHRLCRWGSAVGTASSAEMRMETHAVDVMQHGVRLGVETWADFTSLLDACKRPAAQHAQARQHRAKEGSSLRVDRVICHQVGASNRDAILAALRIPPERDFSTFDFLGNIGTVSLPITLAMAAERGFLQPGDRVGLLGIGSGLNCLMLAVDW